MVAVERPNWASFVYLLASAVVSYWLIRAESGEDWTITWAHNVRKVARWVDCHTTLYIDHQLENRRTV